MKNEIEGLAMNRRRASGRRPPDAVELLNLVWLVVELYDSLGGSETNKAGMAAARDNLNNFLKNNRDFDPEVPF